VRAVSGRTGCSGRAGCTGDRAGRCGLSSRGVDRCQIRQALGGGKRGGGSRHDVHGHSADLLRGDRSGAGEGQQEGRREGPEGAPTQPSSVGGEGQDGRGGGWGGGEEATGLHEQACEHEKLNEHYGTAATGIAAAYPPHLIAPFAFALP
jgi:hypothetical protein